MTIIDEMARPADGLQGWARCDQNSVQTWAELPKKGV